MAHSVAKHLQKAGENKAFSGSLQRNTPTQTGWAITAAFYSALHFVQAYLVSIGADVRNHIDREHHVEQMPDLQSIYADYRDLQTLSENCRYEMNEYNEQVYLDAVESLDLVERHIQGLLATKQPPSPSRSIHTNRPQHREEPRPMPGRPSTRV